jgi:hypothetical protein
LLLRVIGDFVMKYGLFFVEPYELCSERISLCH